MRVVCNAGPLIVLGKLNALHLMSANYEELLISKEVYAEVVGRGLEKGHVDAARIKRLVDNGTIAVKEVAIAKRIEFELELDIGEIETILLSLKEKADLVLIDNWHARVEARRKGLKVKGTLGVLYESLKKGIIEYERFESLVEEIIYRDNIWISKELCREVLKRANKLKK